MNKGLQTYLLGLITAIILLFIFKDCSPKVQPPLAQIKQEVKQKKMESDSIKFRIRELKDTVIIYRDRWHKAKTMYSTIYKNDTIVKNIIQACDSVLQKDSTLISELKAVIKIDSLIIEGQDNIIRADSLTIIDLTKSVKRQKRRTKIMTAIAVIIGGLALTK